MAVINKTFTYSCAALECIPATPSGWSIDSRFVDVAQNQETLLEFNFPNKISLLGVLTLVMIVPSVTVTPTKKTSTLKVVSFTSVKVKEGSYLNTFKMETIPELIQVTIIFTTPMQVSAMSPLQFTYIV